MKIPFFCPACGATGNIEAAYAGRQGSCKQCKHRFMIPKPGEAEEDAYRLDGPPAARVEIDPEPASAFIRARGDERTAPAVKRGRATPKARDRPARDRDFSWGTWMLRGAAIALLVLAAIALVAPNGITIVGASLLGIGSLMVLLGYGAGAYGAFCEDLLYGFLYVVFPLYAAYYLVSRWEDLWPWFACSTLGVGLVLFGTEMLRWAGTIP